MIFFINENLDTIIENAGLLKNFLMSFLLFPGIIYVHNPDIIHV